MHIETRRLSYKQINLAANNFLQNLDMEINIPIDIEAIIEIYLGIEIVPLHGLNATFVFSGLSEVEAYTSKDLKTIYIDKQLFDSGGNRYRFTLAHELGHIILHKFIYDSLSYTTTDEWIQLNKNIPQGDYRWFEYQAYSFAGSILVPTTFLVNKLREIIPNMLERNSCEIDLSDPSMCDPYWSFIYEEASQQFKVSLKTIEIRVEKEDLFYLLDEFV